ncbi:hypothetical protein [Azospirillum endophyticum]
MLVFARTLLGLRATPDARVIERHEGLSTEGPMRNRQVLAER